MAIGDWGARVDLREQIDRRANRRLRHARSTESCDTRTQPTMRRTATTCRRPGVGGSQIGCGGNMTGCAKPGARRLRAVSQLVATWLTGSFGSDQKYSWRPIPSASSGASFGKSSNRAAPGLFVELLRRRCRELRVPFWFVPTSLRLSRTCHGCGRVAGKQLRERVHACPCASLHSEMCTQHGLQPSPISIHRDRLGCSTLTEPAKLGRVRDSACQRCRVHSR